MVLKLQNNTRTTLILDEDVGGDSGAAGVRSRKLRLGLLVREIRGPAERSRALLAVPLLLPFA